MKNIFKNSTLQQVLFSGNRTARSAWTSNYIQKPGAGKIQTVTLIPGYAIGPEITSKYFFKLNIIHNHNIRDGGLLFLSIEREFIGN